MTTSTKDRLVAVAAELLDLGGQEAVTLRAVAERVGVSHNAPYRHFADRNALLAGVATRDFRMLAERFRTRAREPTAMAALRNVSEDFVTYGLQHPARYRLLFSDPDLQASGELKAAAFVPFQTFLAIVQRCQGEKVLPTGDPLQLAGMLYSTIHGSIDLVIGGRATSAKGVENALSPIELMFSLLIP